MMKTIHLTGLFVVVFLLFVSLLPPSTFGEILTIKQTVKQTFGGGQSADDARIYGIAKAKREALEKAGTYIESLTVVKNYKVEKDEILAITAGVLKAEVISQKNYASDDAFGIEIVVNVVVDTSVLEERVKKQLQDRTHLTQLKDTQKRETELLQKVAQLEDENRKLMAKMQSTEKIKKEFQQASDGLTAVDWVNKAFALLWSDGKVANPKKAIEYLNNSIKLEPDNAITYLFRGLAYADLNQYQRAIEDYNEAISLDPDLAYAYGTRGAAYFKLNEYQRVIEDLNKAIRLQPDYAEAYHNRGLYSLMLGQYQRAIEDFNTAIRLHPDYADAYYGRGLVYCKLNQYQHAIEDFNKAIRHQPDYAEAYYRRGLVYAKLKQYQLSISDLSVVIRMKPNDAEAYHNRGALYSGQGKYNLGCRDAQKACALGDCRLLEMSKGLGHCR